ncbi:parallel beta-helix repeat protein [Vibrio phage 1.021.C._10N.222.51.F9]|nr:parallel beta-helix repeat protein [Vibrio phage 1.021.A._10N.222.51.F9]AUR82133.1 parallel beta-helix repeat protein [Vibrio phage 1.021.B._10N.222.51.F9]AUR82183.1 parallel beta-helix repeat protein [Vibrio phage 1.021.C._10N.222.51.F9]
MATQVKHRRGTQSEIDNFTGALGEIVVNTTEEELVLNNGATQGGIPIPKKRNTVLSFDTLTLAVANTSLKAGYSVELKERTTGNGGGGKWDVVLASTVSPNTFNIVQCTGVPSLALVLRVEGDIDIKQFGAVGDGVTDDNAAINAAHEFARDLVGYNTVIVPPSESGSEYIFTQIKVYSKTTFKGEGGVLKLKDNTVTDVGLSYYPINNLGEDRVIYDGLIVEGNSANNPAPVVCDTITCTGFRSKVINCVLFNAVDSGVMFSGAIRAYCKNNYVENARDLCIYVNASVDGDLDESIVSNNICKGAPFGGIGIKRFAANCIVEGNTIDDCGNGITVEDFGGGSNPTNLQILNNSMRRIGYTQRGASVAERGISISRAENLIVSGNRVRDCSGNCILASNLSDSIISNNHLVGYTTDPAASGNNGIIASITPVSNVVVEGNVIKGVATRGIYFGDPTECQIVNNQVESVSSALRINASGSENIVTGNVLYGTGGLDVELFAGAVTVYKDNILKNGSTELAKYGVRTISAGQPFPDVSGFVALSPGEEVLHLADTSWWKSYGTGAGEWKRMTT